MGKHSRAKLMIISASYKTDIPAFYGEWFMNRLRAGYCKVANPYNRKLRHVDLRREAVDGCVFWTKNIAPFTRHLPEIRERGFPFVIQHTINAYPRAIEAAVVNSEKAIQEIIRLADTFGPKACVWRYDTIINSSITPKEYHLEAFSRMARSLEGAVDEVVIAFARMYRKTLRNMQSAGHQHDFTWDDPSDEWKNNLSIDLAEIAASHRIRLTVCGQPKHVPANGHEAHCIDAARLAEVSGRPLTTSIKGNRKDCACYAACDIGEYDTCPHGCAYCYAVQSQSLAKRRYRLHNPAAETLFPLTQTSGLSSEENQAHSSGSRGSK